MTAEELLLELRDIQAPVEPGWWLLAPAWSSALALSVLLLLFLWLVLWYRRKNRLLLEARQRLQIIRDNHARKQNIHQTLQALSAWLRQVAMAAFPDQQITALTGPAWIDFLNQCSNVTAFDREMTRLFAVEIYQQGIQADANHAIESCETWLNAISNELRYRGGSIASA